VTNRSTFLARKLNKEAHKKNHARHAGKEETEAVSGIANVAKNINDLPSETSTLLLQKILSSKSLRIGVAYGICMTFKNGLFSII
jgi:hypothetical protein